MTRRLIALVLALMLWLVPIAGLAADPPRPGDVPRDATGRCVDGTWTSAAKKRGACSQHGGVKAWFGKPPRGAVARCGDGTFSKSSGQGACSRHGGVAYLLNEPAAKP